MPLDPFFKERLRLHRRYLIGQALGPLTARLRALWPFPRKAPTLPTATIKPRAAKPASEVRATPSRLRARHRRAALAWDRKELETGGLPGPDVRTVEHMVAAPPYPSFRVRIYYPDTDPGVDVYAPVPACLTFFGGAFRIGGIDYPTTDAANRRRAVDAGVAMVAVDYALAPEHRYPTQVEQGYAALEWLFENATRLGIDAERIGISGTSAGGNIAAAVAQLNRERARLPVRLQLLEVPVLDLTGRHLHLWVAWLLLIPISVAVRELRSVARTYLPDPADAHSPFASPLRAESLTGLPPAVILTAEYDPLRGDGEAYGAALRRAGVDVSVVRYMGVTHDTPIYTAALPAARRWHEVAVSALRRL